MRKFVYKITVTFKEQSGVLKELENTINEVLSTYGETKIGIEQTYTIGTVTISCEPEDVDRILTLLKTKIYYSSDKIQRVGVDLQDGHRDRG